MPPEPCPCRAAEAEPDTPEDAVRCQRCGAEWHSSAAAAVMLADGWKCLRCGEPLDDTPRPPAPPAAA